MREWLAFECTKLRCLSTFVLLNNLGVFSSHTAGCMVAQYPECNEMNRASSETESDLADKLRLSPLFIHYFRYGRVVVLYKSSPSQPCLYPLFFLCTSPKRDWKGSFIGFLFS